ncbi:MAG: FUN14 domain-containing protein [Planctomycetota bacterium]
MTETDEHDPIEEAEERTPMAAWKKALVVFALVAGVFGWSTMARAEEAAQEDAARMSAASADGSTVLPTSLSAGDFNGGQIPGIPGEGGSAAASNEAPLWAPLLAKGGLSFFVAFCIGFALRTFLKGTMLVVGVVALAIFGLQKAGIVGDVDWTRAQGYWDDLTANIGAQFASLKQFVTGSLPSAGSAGVGLVAGFRR